MDENPDKEEDVSQNNSGDLESQGIAKAPVDEETTSGSLQCETTPDVEKEPLTLPKRRYTNVVVTRIIHSDFSVCVCVCVCVCVLMAVRISLVGVRIQLSLYPCAVKKMLAWIVLACSV